MIKNTVLIRKGRTSIPYILFNHYAEDGTKDSHITQCQLRKLILGNEKTNAPRAPLRVTN